MPYRTPYGSHYHETYGCCGATEACGTAGLEPCSICCGAAGSDPSTGGGEASGGTVGAAGADAGDAPYEIEASPVDDAGQETSGEGEDERSVQQVILDAMGMSRDGADAVASGTLAAPQPLGHDSYMSRAVPGMRLTGDEIRTVATVLARYAQADELVGDYDSPETNSTASERDFMRVLGAIAHDIVPETSWEEHEDNVRRETWDKAVREIATNYHAVDALPEPDEDYLPFTAVLPPFREGEDDIWFGVPDFDGGWEGMPIQRAARNSHWTAGSGTYAMDYVRSAIESGEEVPVATTIGRYRIEATVRCGVSQEPGATVRAHRQAERDIRVARPPHPRVEHVAVSRVLYDGRPVPVSGTPTDDHTDFASFRRDLEDWLAAQERRNMPAYGQTMADRRGRAFTRWCMQRDAKEAEERGR